MLARPQVKLETRRNAVSSPTLRRLTRSRHLGPPGRVAGQHRIGGEEGGEHDDVAQQENPEAVAGDDALRNRSPGRVPLRVLAIRRLPVVPEVMRVIEAAGRID